jgi:hypothetical protein
LSKSFSFSFLNRKLLIFNPETRSSPTDLANHPYILRLETTSSNPTSSAPAAVNGNNTTAMAESDPANPANDNASNTEVIGNHNNSHHSAAVSEVNPDVVHPVVVHPQDNNNDNTTMEVHTDHQSLSNSNELLNPQDPESNTLG